MKSNGQRFLAKAFMLALVAFMALPMVALGQGRGRGRGKPTEIFVNGHDARDGRYDDQRRRDRDRDNDGIDDRDERRERRRERREDRRADRRDDRDDNYGGYRNRDNYGNYGGSYQLRQTALNAGYNNGMQEGRKDRDRNERFNYADESAYRNATQDYSSRLGDRDTYQRYFREAFARGYNDGFRGSNYNDGYNNGNYRY
ncbi:MAG: hypothetical protein LC802_13515 [Acidobacteria bacterium]|nr:hypothetical protein [Acidobacteriota bacterium]